MKTLSYDEFIDIMNCLLTDGAENTDMSLVHVISETNSRAVCGYGGENMQPGKYLLVWDSVYEEDGKWSTMYAYLKTHDFKMCGMFNNSDAKYDILMPMDEDYDNDCCVWFFKLTEE